MATMFLIMWALSYAVKPGEGLNSPQALQLQTYFPFVVCSPLAFLALVSGAGGRGVLPVPLGHTSGSHCRLVNPLSLPKTTIGPDPCSTHECKASRLSHSPSWCTPANQPLPAGLPPHTLPPRSHVPILTPLPHGPRCPSSHNTHTTLSPSTGYPDTPPAHSPPRTTLPPFQGVHPDAPPSTPSPPNPSTHPDPPPSSP